QDEAVPAHVVKRPHVEAEQRLAFALRQLIALGERGRRLEISLPPPGNAVDVSEQLLQRVHAHGSGPCRSCACHFGGARARPQARAASNSRAIPPAVTTEWAAPWPPARRP